MKRFVTGIAFGGAMGCLTVVIWLVFVNSVIFGG